MTLRRIPLLLLLALVPHEGACGDADGIAKELTAALEYEAQIRVMQTGCLTGIGKTDMEVLYKTDPGKFGGIDPHSEYWQEARAIYGDFMSAVCMEPSLARQLSIADEAFAQNMSPEDMQRTLEFYRTPAGKKLLVANLAIAKKAIDMQMTEYSDMMLKAYDRYEREIESLRRRARPQPSTP